MNRNYNSEKEKNYTKKKVDEKAVMYFLEKKKNTVLRHGSMIRPIWGGGGKNTERDSNSVMSKPSGIPRRPLRSRSSCEQRVKLRVWWFSSEE